MSMTTVGVENAKPSVLAEHLRDLSELSKPRITAMVLVTVALSVFVASAGRPDVFVLINTLIGTVLIAASSSAWNQWIERESDGDMPRTAGRPLPSGRMSVPEVLSFGCITLVAGTAYLVATVGWQPTWWALATWFVYVCVYTPLKPISSWNTAVGAISGALPILIGWSAVGSPLDWRIGGMFLILFVWQFPHFIAIAWLYRRQYGKAGLQMITVTDPSGRWAGASALVGAVVLTGCSLLPLLSGMSWIYACLALALGAYQTFFAWQFGRELTDSSARRLLAASIIYLPLALGMIAAQTVL